MSATPYSMVRLTCTVHHRITPRLVTRLAEITPEPVFTDSARSVRRVNRKRPFGIPGVSAHLEDAPADQIQVVVAEDKANQISHALIETGELDVPGHGSVFIQDCVVHTGLHTPVTHETTEKLVHDLVLITAILSVPESSSTIASLALDLGTSVPVVRYGTGTGLRDQLGLLRITVPARKEIVQIIAPRHDAESIIRLLMEEGRLNLPGRGYLYYTPVSVGYLDTGLRIGPHLHAASMEQVIAAIDGIRGGTNWRRRFPAFDAEGLNAPIRVGRDNTEITIRCPEDHAPAFVNAAIDAGARGATTLRSQRMHSGSESQNTPWELTVITVPDDTANTVVRALCEAAATHRDGTVQIETVDCPATFSFGR